MPPRGDGSVVSLAIARPAPSPSQPDSECPCPGSRIRSVSRHTLYLDGWQRESNWGWDPGQSVWYAQLWVDGTEPGGNDGHDAPALWLTPPSYEIQSRQVLAAHIADFLDVALESVLQAFAESYNGPWQIYGARTTTSPSHRSRTHEVRCIRTSAHQRLRRSVPLARAGRDIRLRNRRWLGHASANNRREASHAGGC
jgi:hypothetical protein